MSESEDVSVGVSQLTEARMWLLSKCRSVCGSVQNAMDKGRRSDTNRASQLRSGMQSLVITPTSIPPFIIPSPENLKNRACNEDAGISTSSDSVSCSDQLSPEDGAALQVQMNRWNKSCHSEPVSPVKQPTPVSVFRRCHAISYDMLDEAPKRTNADPLSLPALSLPHLKTKTKFGFETLFESPNTNRKESLFHGNNFQARRSSLFTHGPPEPRNPEYNSAEMLNNISGTDSCMEPITRSRTRRQDVLWHVAPLGVPLVLAPTEKSEATKRSSSTSPYMIRGRTKRSIKNTVEENISDDESPQSSLHHVIRRRRRRRRQSVGGHVANKDSDTAAGSEEESSDDMMSSQRRHSSCDIHLEPSQIERLLLLSAMTSTSGAPPPPSSLLESESSSRLVNCRPVAAEGELKFVMKYHPRTRQLSVRLLRGYNIGGQHNCDMTTSPFVKLSLFPGKLQQCRTNIVKHTKNPVFNKCFYFNDIDVRQLRCTYLHMKVMNRVYQLKRDEHLGDIQVNLADADLLSEEEQKMRRELQPVLKVRQLLINPYSLLVGLSFFSATDQPKDTNKVNTS